MLVHTAGVAQLLVLLLVLAGATANDRFVHSSVNFTGGEFSVQFGSVREEDNGQLAPKKMSVNVSLAEAFRGTNFLFEYQRAVWSHACTSFGVCAACQGTGVRRKAVSHAHPFLTSTVTHSCPICGGKKHIHFNCPEPTRQQHRARVLVQMPPGLNCSTTLTFENAGDEAMHQSEPRRFGDLHLVLKVHNPDTSVSLDNFDVIKDIEMDARMALEGFETQFEHLDDSVVLVNRSGRVTLPGSELVIAGKGMPIPGTNTAGSLKIRFKFAKFDTDGNRLKQPSKGPPSSQAVCDPGTCTTKDKTSALDDDANYIHEVLLRRALQELSDQYLPQAKK